MRLTALFLILCVLTFWWHTRPELEIPFALPDGDKTRGEYLATAGGCASCHGENYQGGDPLYSPFGTFFAPNITPAHYTANREEFARAMINGVGVNGQHLYPAFPYSSYKNLTAQDIADLYAYIRDLEAVEAIAPPHDLPIYARWRRGLGLWKKMRPKTSTPTTRGEYLAETIGHCQECHTPRTVFGTLNANKAYQGGDIYGEKGKLGKASNLLTGDASHWSVSELSSYFEDGFTPDYDSVGGEMVEVVDNLSKLTDEDRDAIAAYVQGLSE